MFRSRARRRSAGFTLVEVLVVTGIMGGLQSQSQGNWRYGISKANEIKGIHNLKQIHLGIGMYLNDNDNAYPCADDPVSTSPFYWLWMGRGWRGWISTSKSCICFMIQAVSLSAVAAFTTSRYQVSSQ